MEQNNDPRKILEEIQKLDREICKSLISLMKEMENDRDDIDEIITKQIPDWKQKNFNPNEWVYWGIGNEFFGQVFGFSYYELDGLLDLMAHLTNPSSRDIFFCDLLDENARWVYSVYHYQSSTLYFIDQKYLTSAKDVPGVENDMLIPKPLYEVGEEIQWSVRTKPGDYPVWLGAGVILAKEYAYTSSQIISKARNNEQHFSLAIKTQLPCWTYLVRNITLPSHTLGHDLVDLDFWIPESFVSSIDPSLLEEKLDVNDWHHPLICAIENCGQNYENVESFESGLRKIYDKMSINRLNHPRKFNNEENISWTSQIPVGDMYDEEFGDWVDIFKGEGKIVDAIYMEEDLESFLYFDSISQSYSDFCPCVLVDWEAFKLASLYSNNNKIAGWIYLITIDPGSIGETDVEIWLPELYIKRLSLNKTTNPPEEIDALQLSLYLNGKGELGDLAVPMSLRQAMMIDSDMQDAYDEGIIENIKTKIWWDNSNNCF